jgi:hypothetical protein
VIRILHGIMDLKNHLWLYWIQIGSKHHHEFSSEIDFLSYPTQEFSC